MPEEQINSLREFVEKRTDLYAGIWTWSRGGGWGGPYIENEMWCDLNAWEQAKFFNEVYKITKKWDGLFVDQLQYVTDSKALTTEGREIMEHIGNYSEKEIKQ